MLLNPPQPPSAQSLWPLMQVTCHSSSTTAEFITIRKLTYSLLIDLRPLTFSLHWPAGSVNPQMERVNSAELSENYFWPN